MSIVGVNEREFGIQLVSWLNEFIGNGSYPFVEAGGESSVPVAEGKTNFPDVIIWLNRSSSLAFCGFELKTPTTQVDDQETLENAAKKARALGVNFFITWNMREAVIWKVPLQSIKVSAEYRQKVYPVLHQISEVGDLLVGSKKLLLKKLAQDILFDLKTLHEEGHLHQKELDSTYFTKVLHDAVHSLCPFYFDALKTKIGKDKQFRDELILWAKKQGIANPGDETYFETLSRQMVYRLVGKILFYLTLKKFRDDLPKLDLEGVVPVNVDNKLRGFFEDARQIDYQAVFEEDFSDRIAIPLKAVDSLVKLVTQLNQYNFGLMPQDVIGQVFEKLIPPEERHTLGQYFTPEDLVDLIVSFCVQSVDDKVLDPTCGTGTFLNRSYDRLKGLGKRSHSRLLQSIWGIDIAHFPSELATINLFKQNLNDYGNFPRVQSMDFFNVKPGMEFEFPPPKVNEREDFKVKEKIPEFNAIVGNFPYIRQEIIEKSEKGYKRSIESVIAEDWLKEDESIFEINKATQRHLDKARRAGEPLKDFYSKVEMRLSGQADIYAYLFYHAGRFLKEGGRIGIITSNSWLDVAYGYDLQKFFLNHFKIIAVLESRCEAWFEDAAVNTVVTVLERCSDSELRARQDVKFVKLKKRLKELIPYDLLIDATKRWSHVSNFTWFCPDLCGNWPLSISHRLK